MKVVVARDAVTLEDLETVWARCQVGKSLKAVFVADMEVQKELSPFHYERPLGLCGCEGYPGPGNFLNMYAFISAASSFFGVRMARSFRYSLSLFLDMKSGNVSFTMCSI
nr:hypothetical protein [Tanacetum cinerariifolium]